MKNAHKKVNDNKGNMQYIPIHIDTYPGLSHLKVCCAYNQMHPISSIPPRLLFLRSHLPRQTQGINLDPTAPLFPSFPSSQTM